MMIFATLSLLFSSTFAFAAGPSKLAPVGSHYKVITVEKSINPENIMVVYTKLDSKCRFQTDPAERDQPVFDFYWLMNRKTYKPVHSLIKGEVKKRLEFELDPENRAQSFYVRLNDMKEVRHDLKDTRLHVIAGEKDGKCEVNATMTLGRSAGSQTIYLDKVYSEAKKALLMPKLVSISLSGRNVETGKSARATYKAK